MGSNIQDLLARAGTVIVVQQDGDEGAQWQVECLGVNRAVKLLGGAVLGMAVPGAELNEAEQEIADTENPPETIEAMLAQGAKLAMAVVQRYSTDGGRDWQPIKLILDDEDEQHEPPEGEPVRVWASRLPVEVLALITTAAMAGATAAVEEIRPFRVVRDVPSGVPSGPE